MCTSDFGYEKSNTVYFLDKDDEDAGESDPETEKKAKKKKASDPPVVRRWLRMTFFFCSCFFLLWIIKNHVYSVEQTDLVLPCSKTYRLDEKFVDTAKNQPARWTRRSACQR